MGLIFLFAEKWCFVYNFFFFEEVDVIAAGNGEGKGKYLVKTCKWWYFYNYEAIGTLAGFF